MQATLPAETVARVDSYWERFLGCTEGALRSGDDLLLPGSLASGLFAVSAGRGWVAVMPPVLAAVCGQQALEMLQTSPEEGPWNDVFAGHRIHEVYGPATLSYCTTHTFRPGDEKGARALAPGDGEAVRRFAAEFGGIDWEFGTQGWPFGAAIFDGDRIACGGAVREWGGAIGEIFADTLPAYRGRGYATAVCRRLTRWILEETNLLAQHDAEPGNVASMRLASEIGYLAYGRLLYVELETWPSVTNGGEDAT